MPKRPMSRPHSRRAVGSMAELRVREEEYRAHGAQVAMALDLFAKAWVIFDFERKDCL